MYVFYFHFEMRVASRIRRVVYTVFIFDYNFLARNRNDDPAGIRWINSDLIGFTYK